MWLLNRADLFPNIIGTLLAAFSFGKNPENAEQRGIYLTSLLHPLMFKIGCGLLGLGFIAALFMRTP